jgi:translocation and assembly module TamB
VSGSDGRLRRVLAVVALGAVGAVFLLRTERVGALVCDELRARVPEALGLSVTIERCALDPLRLSVEVHQLALVAEGAKTPVLAAERASVSLRGLFFGGVALQELRVVRPEIDLRLPEGEAVQPDDAPAACPLELLQRVRVGTLRIEDGRVRLRRGKQELRFEGVTVQASLGRREAELTLDARSGAATVAEGRSLRLGRLAVDARLETSGAQLEVQRADLSVEGITVGLSGQLEGLCDSAPQVTASGQVFVPIDALPRLGLSLPASSGQVWARLAVSGRLDALTARAELQSSQVAIGPYSPGDFSARLVLADQRLLLEDFATKSGDGELHVSGELQLTEGLPVKAKVDIRDASFAQVLARASVPGSWVEFPATVKGSVTGHLQPFPVLDGDMEFQTGPFSLTARAWDAPVAEGLTILAFSRSEGTFHFGFSKEGVTFQDVRLRVGAEGRTRVRGDVRLNPFDMAHFLSITVQGDQVDLADFGAISELPWAGVGTVSGSVHSSPGNVSVEAQMTLRDFELDGYSLGVAQGPIRYEGDTLSFPAIIAQKGQTQYFGDVALEFLPAGLHVRSTVQLPDGRVEDLVDLLADLSPMIQNLQAGALTGRVSALAALDSPASALEGVIAMQLRDVAALDRRLGAAEVITRFDRGQALVLEPCVFEGPLGRFSAGGRWAFAGPLSFQLAIDHGSFSELVDPAGVDAVPVAGVFSAHARVGGDTDTVQMDGWLSSPEVRWHDRVLGPSHLEGRLVGQDFTVFGTVFPGLKGTLSTKTRSDWPYQAALTVELDDLSPFLAASGQGISARVKGTVAASGPLLEWRKSTATAKLEALTVARGEVSASNTAPVELGYAAGGYEVRSLAMKGPTTEFDVEGRWGPLTVDLQSRGSVDLRLLSSLLPSVDRTQGRLDFVAAFTGLEKSPALAGSAQFSDVRFVVQGQDLQVKSLAGRADFSESRVLLQEVQGLLNDGRVRARGDVRLERLAVKAVELQVDLEEVTVQAQPDVPVTLSGGLLATTKNASVWQLQGALEVDRLRYTQPLTLESLVASARRGLQSDAAPEEWLKLDVDLTTGDDVRIDNNLARMRLNGKLKLGGTNVKPVLAGAIEAGQGAQAFFRGNTFSVSRGVLQLSGLSPTFDLSAQSQVREYLVSLKAFGRLENPEYTLSSEPALPETDLLSLLTIGVTSRERLSGQSGASLAAEALLSASGLDEQVQKFLQQSVGLKDQQVRLTTSFNEVTGTADPSVAWESKVLSDSLKIGVTQPVTGRGTKAQAEYRFNQRVSARLQWDNQNQNTSIGNPGLDLRFRFEWE